MLLNITLYFALQIENFQNMKFPVILSSVLILAFSTTIYGQVSDDINKKRFGRAETGVFGDKLTKKED